MKEKSIKDLTLQKHRIERDAYARHGRISRNLNNAVEYYVDNIKEYLGLPRGWRVCSTKTIEDIKVPFEVYTGIRTKLPRGYSGN